jgi:hypothetical protein
METFKGKDFLEGKKVKIELSNGQAFEVSEISQEIMDSLEKMEGSEGVTLKDQLAHLCAVDKSTFDEVGVVEMRGVMDFLSENLLGLK